MVLSVVLRQIAGRFEPGWYSSMNVSVSLLSAGSLVVIAMNLVILLAPFIVLLFLLSLVKKSERKSPKLLILFLPFIPFATMLVWASCVAIRFSLVDSFGYNHWSYKVLADLVSLQAAHFKLIAIFIALSRCWKGMRKFGISVIVMEYCFFCVARILSSTTCSNLLI